MNRNSKAELVAELAGKLASAKATFIADYRGLSVDEVNDLRGKLRAAGVEYQVVKNTLLKLAIKDTDTACIEEFLQGPTAIAFATEDPVAPAKVLSDYAKGNAKFELKGGSLEGKVLDLNAIRALSDLPSREVLLAKMLGSMNAPVSNFVGVLAAVPRSLVQVLAAIQDKKAA